MEETGRKCIVDGERNVKVYRKNKEEGHHFIENKLWQSTGEVAVIRYADQEPVSLKLLQPGEGLSAVSFAKRCFEFANEFPSTAEVALMDLLETMHNGKKFSDSKINLDYRRPFTPHFDEQLYYEDNLTAKYFDKHGLFPNLSENEIENKVKTAIQALGSLKEKAASDFDDKPFTKYYALIQFDGDNMGKWLSGDEEFLTVGDSGMLGLEQFHRDFTDAVGAFAKDVEEQLKAPRGRTVFAGGEDFLGFINLHHLFPVMYWLRALYREKVHDALNGKTTDYRIAPGRELTLSTGVVIAHYKEPLSEVMQTLAAAEKQAKDGGRNRFVIRASKHAGGDVVCSFSWQIGSEATTKVLNLVTEKLEKDFSNTFITEIVHTLQVMQMQPPPGLLGNELKRTVQRSCKMEKRPEESQADFKIKKDRAIDFLIKNLQLLMSECLKNPDPKKGHQNFSEVLALCDFITRKTR